MLSTKTHTQKRTAAQNKSSFGPRHNPIGEDAEGGYHHWNRDTHTVYVIKNGSVEHREDLTAHQDKGISEWVEYVADERDWRSCKFVSLQASDLGTLNGGY